MLFVLNCVSLTSLETHLIYVKILCNDLLLFNMVFLDGKLKRELEAHLIFLPY